MPVAQAYLVNEWTPENGAKLHSLQVAIALRGLHMLKVNGRMVYSTCSLNPAENEAVVAQILRACGGRVSVVDVSKELPSLVRRPGLTQWKTPLDLQAQDQERKRLPTVSAGNKLCIWWLLTPLLGDACCLSGTQRALRPPLRKRLTSRKT